MDSPTTGIDDELEVPTLGQICQRLDTMDGKLNRVVEKVDRQTDLLISLVQRTAAPDAAPTNSAHLAAHTAASGATGIAHGASSASHTLTTSAVARPGNTHPLAPSAASGSAGVAQGSSSASHTRPATPGTRPGNARPPPTSAASGSAGVAQGSSSASHTRPATPGTRSDNTRTMVSKGKGKGKGRPRQEDIPEPLPAPKYLAVDETELPWDDEGCGYSPVASTSAVMLRAQPSRAAQSGLGARMPVRGHGSNNELCDAMGVAINSDRVSTLLEMFSLMSLDMLPIAYEHIFGHSPFHPNTPRSVLNQRLARLEGFAFFSIQHSRTTFDFLLRQGPGLVDRHQYLETRLRLTSEHSVPVPAPLLCYFLITLVCMPVDRMTGFILGEAFRVVTKRELGSLWVATENGVKQLDADVLCDMAKRWVHAINASIIVGDVIQQSLEIAEQCNKLYLVRCRENGGIGASIDTDGMVAEGMLAKNVCFSCLVLGIEAAELEMLIRHMGYMELNE
ncbi:hypothetical protein GGI17_003012 [Coemansia sp. S146]|nr:hypothetical protein GGI17_003012 [Coemansia sp. S146]